MSFIRVGVRFFEGLAEKNASRYQFFALLDDDVTFVLERGLRRSHVTSSFSSGFWDGELVWQAKGEEECRSVS